MKIYGMVIKYERLAELDRDAYEVSPPIQRTCGQIYEETKRLFYMVNTFAYYISTKAGLDLLAFSSINVRQAKLSTHSEPRPFC